MTARADLVIRNGRIIDGTGSEAVEADIAVTNGRIVAVGSDVPAGREEIDARGAYVTPGFIDLHTHYDGQVTWENQLSPSSAHGVTTAIIGNCGVGFAPCKPEERELLICLMEGVEDIPHPVLAEGLPWTWESFPDYLDLLASRQFDMDVGAYLPHAPLRVYVMGQRAVDLEQATPDDLAKMQVLAREGIAAGAMGIATSRTLYHRSSDGNSIPTLRASEDELHILAGAMKEEGRGIFQLAGDIVAESEGVDFLERINRLSGRPVTFSYGTPNTPFPHWASLFDKVEAVNAEGGSLYPQVLPRAVGVLLGFELTMTPFDTSATFKSLGHLPFEEKIKALGSPEIRSQILGEVGEVAGENSIASHVRQFGSMFVLGDPPEYEQPPERSIAAMAASRGISPDELAYDLLLENGGRTYLYLAMANYADGRLDVVATMLSHRDTLPGLGDGGAHCGTICDGSYSTFLLTYFARDRKEGRLTLPEAVRKLTSAPAGVIGLHDRGVVAPGYRADLNIIDFDKLQLHAPRVTYDLPAGGRRLVQDADGYLATIVNGTIVRRDGVATGALPGRLLRGEQKAPSIG